MKIQLIVTIKWEFSIKHFIKNNSASPNIVLLLVVFYFVLLCLMKFVGHIISCSIYGV